MKIKKFLKISSHVLLVIGLLTCFFASAIFLGWTTSEMNGTSYTDINQTESNFQLINKLFVIGFSFITIGIIFDIKDFIRNFPNINDN